MKEKYSIGVDLGGTNLRVASYRGGGDFIDSSLLPTRLAEGPEQIVRDMCEVIELHMGRSKGRELIGVGVGAPGPMELPEGVLRNPPNLPGWDGFDLRSALESALGMRVEIEGDANVAALAEQRIGAGKSYGVDTLCVLTLGTGVGSGLILDGEIWHGSTGMGGEAGHVVVKDVDGNPCGCGGYGCLEQYASASAVVRMANELMPNRGAISAHKVALLAQSGDPDAIRVFEQVGHALAIGLTGLINTLNLPLYLLGGGVCEAWSLFAPTMFSELRRRSYVYRLTEPVEREPKQLERHKTYIMSAELGSNAGLLGACLLPHQKKSPTPGLIGELSVR